MTHAAPASHDANERCARCGYALDGLGGGAACPECGLAACHSAGGAPLASRPMPYLRRLHSGLGLVAIGGVLLLSLMVLYGVLLKVPNIPISPVLGITLFYVYTPFLLIAPSAVLSGLYMFASPDRPIEEGARPTRSRKVLRLSLVGLVATGALWWGVWHTPAPGFQTPAFFYHVGPTTAFGIAAATTYFSSMLRMRYVAHRLGCERLASRIGLLMRWIPIVLISSFVLVIYMLWYTMGAMYSNPNLRYLFEYLPLQLPAFLCAVMYLGLVLRIRHRMGVLIRAGRDRTRG